jgi:hypothetical protein
MLAAADLDRRGADQAQHAERDERVMRSELYGEQCLARQEQADDRGRRQRAEQSVGPAGSEPAPEADERMDEQPEAECRRHEHQHQQGDVVPHRVHGDRPAVRAFNIGNS